MFQGCCVCKFLSAINFGLVWFVVDAEHGKALFRHWIHHFCDSCLLFPTNIEATKAKTGAGNRKSRGGSKIQLEGRAPGGATQPPSPRDEDVSNFDKFSRSKMRTGRKSKRNSVA